MKVAFIIAGHSKRCRGAMAAVGLSASETSARCPTGVTVVCENGANAVTVAGPTHAVTAFVSDLKAESTLCTVVNSAGVPFHSPSMTTIRRRLQSSLARILPDSRPSSPRWISTSSPQNSPISAEYFVNNILGSVDFRGACRAIPAGAVALELGPSALFRRLLMDEVGCAAVLAAMSHRNRTATDSFAMVIEGLELHGVALTDPRDEATTPRTRVAGSTGE